MGVSERVIDNGLLRAELGRTGTITRLCFHQQFANCEQPWCAVIHNETPLTADDVSIRVIESGPIRARVVVTHEYDNGSLRLTYTLYAQDDGLQVTATWHGDDDPVWLRHTTNEYQAPLTCGGELSPWSTPQAAHYSYPRPPVQHGIRWAQLGEQAGSFACAANRPISLRVNDGAVDVLLDGTTVYYLCPSTATRGGMNPALRSQHLASWGRAISESDNLPFFRMAGSDHIIPIWLRRPGLARGIMANRSFWPEPTKTAFFSA